MLNKDLIAFGILVVVSVVVTCLAATFYVCVFTSTPTALVYLLSVSVYVFALCILSKVVYDL